MELSTAKTYLPRVLKAKKKKKRFLLSLPHIGSIFMFRKPEETIKIERNKIEMLLRNNFCSLPIRSFRHWYQQVRCVYQPFSSLLSIQFSFFFHFYQFSIFIPILLFCIIFMLIVRQISSSYFQCGHRSTVAVRQEMKICSFAYGNGMAESTYANHQPIIKTQPLLTMATKNMTKLPLAIINDVK